MLFLLFWWIYLKSEKKKITQNVISIDKKNYRNIYPKIINKHFK